MKICIFAGDITVTASERWRVDNDDPTVTYVLSFHDVVNDQKADVVANGENDQAMLIAAWLLGDEPDIGVLNQPRERLRALLPKGFLP